ncbi:MAG TPA: hypothetical protein VGD49_04640, partial [Longimicrobiales bacterium]
MIKAGLPVRLDSILVVVSAAAFVVSMSASALPNGLWLAIVAATLLLNGVANFFLARRGVTLRRSLVTSAVAAGSFSFLLAAAFAATHFIGPDVWSIEAHLMNRAIPWWLAVLVIAGFAGI